MSPAPPWQHYARAARQVASETVKDTTSDPSPAGKRSLKARLFREKSASDPAAAKALRPGVGDSGPGAVRLDLRLAAAAATCWLVALVLLRLPPGVGMAGAALCGGAVTAFLLAGLRRRRRKSIPSVTGTVFLMVCTVGLLALVIGVKHTERLSGPIGPAIESGAYITAELTALSDASRSKTPSIFGSGPRYLVTAEITEASHAGRKFEAATPVLVIGNQTWQAVRYGDRLHAAGTLAPMEPGSSEAAMLSASTAPDVTSTPPAAEAVNALRSLFVEHTGSLPPDARGLLPGMVFGDREQQTDDLEEAMRRTGLTHLMAVSGANCSYLLGFVYLLATACRAPRWLSSVLGIVALAGFVLLVRPEPSVLRAAVMGTIGVAALVSGRRRASLSFLALAVLILLLANPWLAGEYSFILSVLATLGLVLLGSTCSRWLQHFMPKLLADAMAIPLAAQLFCTPVLVQLQPELAMFSIPANILAAPVVPFVTIGGMVSLALLPWAPLPGGWLVHATGFLTLWVAQIARTFSGLPLATLPWLGGPAGAVLAAAAAVVLLALLWLAAQGRAGISSLWFRVEQTSCRGRGSGRRYTPELPASADQGTSLGEDQEAQRGRGTTRRAGTRWTGKQRVGAAFCAAVVAGALLGWLLSSRGVPALPERWDAVVCDVGQGDGLVIRTGTGQAMVIDAGPEPGAMDSCLDSLGVESIGLLVLTHMHLDHYGGLDGVLDGRKVARVLVGSSKKELPDLVGGTLAEHGLDPELGKAGQSGRTGSASWQILWPTAARTGASENDSSIVMLVTVTGADGGVLRILLTGDLEEEAAADLLRGLALEPGSVDVLKISHHGARNGGTAILDRVQPRTAVISVGRDNDYGHPAPTILSALERLRIPVFRTDQIGTIVVDLADGSLAVRPAE
ncbi:ComEC/Rec2 family competence protein [Arthrobacter sp. VKM Ac-2550]|uniref:ComEC/Rec2 family competence protein n=1 Tax=Crystallibacter permensis TaxID=1938888 RepID=UPI002225F2DE|nr:ComEC/Rec2 family competence protein [Arthrobacter sp. VKM Ac-2550]MCW2134006.1 competence protein ComEC [Arthrobacter sp. VKM Ac-2550]